MYRSLLALLGLTFLLAAAAPAEAQFYLKVPFVRVQTGGPEGGVYVKAPLVRVEVPPKYPGYYLVPVLTEPLPPPPPPYEPVPAPTYVLPPQPPAPVVVVPKKGVLTHYEFAKTFVPVAGKHEVTLLHPATNAPVEVSFILPPGSPKVLTYPRSIIFDYGPSEVEIHFAIKGKLRVLYR